MYDRILKTKYYFYYYYLRATMLRWDTIACYSYRRQL